VGAQHPAPTEHEGDPAPPPLLPHHRSLPIRPRCPAAALGHCGPAR
jgi:hypothetical protein